jgi:hypothetical protein
MRTGNETTRPKVVYPQEYDPREFRLLEFQHFYIQAMDGPNQSENLSNSLRHSAFAWETRNGTSVCKRTRSFKYDELFLRQTQ